MFFAFQQISQLGNPFVGHNLSLGKIGKALMLTSTFRHFKGVGAKTERELWRSGVWSWQEFESRHTVQLSMFEVGPPEAPVQQVLTSKEALEKEDANYFALSLPRYEHYRIAHTFPSKTLFLDIETTGLSRYYDQITLVGWSMGDVYNTYIKGDDAEPLRRALVQAKVIVTFNGSLFDVPFLRAEFPELNIPLAHIDLRFLARRVGLRGGQKEIELAVGLERPGILSSLRGEVAPLLWHRYRRGDLDALKLLISYNYADIEGMKFLLDIVTDRLLEMDQLPMRLHPLHRFFDDYSSLSAATLFRDSGRVRKYRGSSAPLMTLEALSVPSHRVVGIDLTGSEDRPSGWCVLQSGRATTRRIGSDKDLIQATIDAKPTLVSIDSPLSLPRGRVTVDDDDPGRQSFGITRECERILKRRGINVYPSLIKSMQALTARGMRLARHFRGLGIAVIESSPGAAHDIINIPRKGADLGLLKEGLAEFGISGEFINQNVSHDELDAITSAVVGLFFMSGKFEGLGNEDEEYLIIPDMKQKTNPWNRHVIGLSGPISSGKTTAGEYLEKRGYAYGRYSQVLQGLLEEKRLEVTRQSLQQIGEEVYKGVGQRWLGAELIKRMPESDHLVIDGLRHPEDHSFLVERFGPCFFHVHIDAPELVRENRYTASEGDKEDFRRAAAHPVEAHVPQLAGLANVIINNDGSLEEFFSKLSEAEQNLRQF